MGVARVSNNTVDGPWEVEETRFGFIWGPVHVERIGVEGNHAGIYLTDGNGNGIEVHVPTDGKGPSRAFRDWRELHHRRVWWEVVLDGLFGEGWRGRVRSRR